MKKRFVLHIIILSILLITSGCSIQFGSGDKDIGGIFKSTNKGDSWVNTSLIPTKTGEAQTIERVNSNMIAIDPSDNKAIYLASYKNGLFYSYDGADNWNVAYTLDRIPVNSVAISNKNRCIIYATSRNKVYKSIDCNRTWASIYNDDNPEVIILDVDVDHYNDNNIYISTSRGEIIKSKNSGDSWQTIKRFNEEIIDVDINPHDSRLIFALTEKSLYRSENSGNTWLDIYETLEDFRYNEGYKDIAISSAQKGLMFLATDYGLLKSDNFGYSWEKLKLITPEKGAIINSIAISALNPDIIYYVTNTTFYRSQDSGERWTTVKLPTTRAGWSLLVDPKNDNIIYMGVKQVEVKKDKDIGQFGI